MYEIYITFIGKNWSSYITEDSDVFNHAKEQILQQLQKDCDTIIFTIDNNYVVLFKANICEINFKEHVED
jgi:hypothetical protein